MMTSCCRDRKKLYRLVQITAISPKLPVKTVKLRPLTLTIKQPARKAQKKPVAAKPRRIPQSPVRALRNLIPPAIKRHPQKKRETRRQQRRAPVTPKPMAPKIFPKSAPPLCGRLPALTNWRKPAPSVKTNPSPRDALGIGNYLGCSSTNGY